MGLINDYYKQGEIVINIRGEQFGGLLKMGDTVAVLNILEFMRQQNHNPNIKFHIPDHALQPGKDYVRIFRDFLMTHSNYISPVPGSYDFEGFVEIWSFRENHGSLIRVDDNRPLKRKICLFPLIDAAYNHERNWSVSLIQSIIDDFSTSEYDGYEKIICVKDGLPVSLNLKGFIVSNDFNDNLNHLFDCEWFIGGDTGTSHLVSIFDNPNRKMLFYYTYGYHGGWLSSFTKPFYNERSNAKMIYYNSKLIGWSPKLHADVLSNLITYRPFENKIRLGVQRDGGYVIADGHNYDFLISGGVGPDISFEIDFMNKYHINGVILDGTVQSPPNLPSNLLFVRKNIGRHTNEHISNLVEYITQYNNVFLKLDIEGGEWELLTSEFSNYLGRVKQITIELHHIFSNDPRVLKSLEALNKTHNIIHIHENNNCHNFVNIGDNSYPETFELTFLRKDVRLRGLNDIHFPINGLDFPNSVNPNHDLNFYPFVVKP